MRTAPTPSTSEASASAGAPLLTPLVLGPRTAPNRIVFGAHLTNFGVGNTFTERHRAYYRARAAGGAGMLVTEALTVHPLDWPYEHVPCGHRDTIVPALAALAETVRASGHESGSGGTAAATPPLLLAQLNHWGGQSSGKLLRQSPWAPSATVEVASKRMARAMEPTQIEAVVAAFAAAAGRVRAAGLDGVELNAGQHGLLRQFLSPLTNQRQDDWGGTLEHRLRLPLAVVDAVRAALGPDCVLGLKLCGDELAPWGGLTPEDAVAIARALVAAGGLDYLSVQIGGPYSAHLTEAAMPTPQAHAAHLAQAVREGIAGALPVFAEGRIESPAVAEGVLAAGQADAVVMTRALISDPDLPRKVAGTHTEPLRPHIGMTRYFSVQGDWNRPLGDLINPRAGREALLPPLQPAAPHGTGRPRPVLVVGGGPAGLEAAATLARLGHAVTLREAGPRLGGMAAVLAEAVEARREFGLLVDYYTALLAHLGVTVEPSRPVAPDSPGLEDFAAVLLATGAAPEAEALSGALPGTVPPPPPFAVEGGRVLSPRALLGGTGAAPEAEALPPPEAGRVAVVDSEGGFRMANAAEWLLAHGYGVDVVTADGFVGRELVESAEFLWFPRVAAQGLEQHPMLEAVALRGQTLHCRERYSGRERSFGPLVFVVAAQPELPGVGRSSDPARDLAAALRARHPHVLTVGDARAPRLMGEAVQHAHRTALELGLALGTGAE